MIYIQGIANQEIIHTFFISEWYISQLWDLKVRSDH